MDRGFELMYPKPKEVQTKSIFQQTISFSLFGKEFELSFKVKQKQE